MLARTRAFAVSFAIVCAACAPRTVPLDCSGAAVLTSLVGELRASPGLLHDRLELYAPLDKRHDVVFSLEQEVSRELSAARAALAQARTPDLAFDHCTVTDWIRRPAEVHPLCIAPLSSLHRLEAEVSRVRGIRDRFFEVRAQNWRRDWSMTELDIQSVREAALVGGVSPACIGMVHAQSAGAFDARALVTFVIDRRDEGMLRVRPLAVQLLEHFRVDETVVVHPAGTDVRSSLNDRG